MVEPATLAAGGVALWLLLRKKKHMRDGVTCHCSVSFERLERSQTASAEGIDNTIPPALLRRACGLAKVVEYLEKQGHRVTSLYRAQAVTEAIYRNSGRTKPYPGPGSHGECRALDIGGVKGEDDPQALAALAAQIEGDGILGDYVTKTLPEGNHLHVEFAPDFLEALGNEAGGVGVS